MTRTVRHACATLVLAAAAFAGGTGAAFAACDAPARAYNQYADRIDAIFTDGFESGDVARVQAATQALTARIDGYTATDDLWKWRKAAIETLVAGLGDHGAGWARLQETLNRIDELREPACG
jgi:hypothetical protein